MPVPKRKVSKSRRDKRQSCKFLRPDGFAACSNCNSFVASHRVCEACGYYKGRKVLTTKIERTMKRGQARQAMAQHQEHSAEAGHDHDAHNG